MGEQTLKDNGCQFFGYCLEAIKKTPHNCTCMEPRYYFDKLEKTVNQCEVLAARRVARKKYLKEEALIKTNQLKQQKDLPQETKETKERQKTADAAEIYIRIFDGFEADPLTDKEIADRLLAFTGIKPTNRNISSYRCNYNQGKLKGQTNTPKDKISRHKNKKTTGKKSHDFEKRGKSQKQAITKDSPRKMVFKIKKNRVKHRGKKHE